MLCRQTVGILVLGITTLIHNNCTIQGLELTGFCIGCITRARYWMRRSMHSLKPSLSSAATVELQFRELEQLICRVHPIVSSKLPRPSYAKSSLEVKNAKMERFSNPVKPSINGM